MRRFLGLVIACIAFWGDAAFAQNAALQGATPVLANNLSTSIKTVKAGPGRLIWYTCTNPNAATAYMQVFDTTSAVILGTTVPQMILPIQSLATANFHFVFGANFLSGIKIAATTTALGGSGLGTALDCSFGIN